MKVKALRTAVYLGRVTTQISQLRAPHPIKVASFTLQIAMPQWLNRISRKASSILISSDKSFTKRKLVLII